MCDAYIPDGALPDAAEPALPSRVTDLLLQHEGVAPANQAAPSGVTNKPFRG
jgi:hypothetical protein